MAKDAGTEMEDGRERTIAPVEPAGQRLQRDISPFDFTLLVVGGMVGDGIYVVAGLGANRLGPAQLLSWVFAGLLAAFIGVAFVQCSLIQPRVGGAYAYARVAFGATAGFMAGWALYLGEMASMPVFPIAFTRYLGHFVDLSAPAATFTVRAVLIGFIVMVNILGVRRGSRLNDVLTIAKLVPLAVLILALGAFMVAHPASAGENLHPFAPQGWSRFGEATLLIFWAYAGFELSVLPASEVRDARATLPRGLVIGILTVTVVYLLTALAVVVAIPSAVAGASERPLSDALGSLLSGLGLPRDWGTGFMSVGALVAIVGVYDVYMLGVARLSYALADGGSFPPLFARLHARYRTPWVGLVFQGAVALVGASLFDMSEVLGVTVVFLGVAYCMTALSALKLASQFPDRRLHLPGLRLFLLLAAVAGGYLAAQASLGLVAAGMLLMLGGTTLYRARRKAWAASLN
jgi:amino acid transporter